MNELTSEKKSRGMEKEWTKRKRGKSTSGGVEKNYIYMRTTEAAAWLSIIVSVTHSC